MQQCRRRRDETQMKHAKPKGKEETTNIQLSNTQHLNATDQDNRQGEREKRIEQRNEELK